MTYRIHYTKKLNDRFDAPEYKDSFTVEADTYVHLQNIVHREIAKRGISDSDCSLWSEKV